jgi:hypothetical protein
MATLKNRGKEDLLAAAWDELVEIRSGRSAPIKNRSREDLLAAAWDELDGVQAAWLPSRTGIKRTC